MVTVPADAVRGQFEGAEEIALWIFAAKNIGIRRARAPFVLATNPDLLFTPALLRAVTRRPLSEDCFYRTSRHDVVAVPLDAGPRRQLAAARRSVARVNLVGGSVHLDPPGGGIRLAREVRRYETARREAAPHTQEERLERPTDWLHSNASGDFFLMHARRWGELRGYPEFASAGHLDSYMCVMAASVGLRQVILDGRRRLYHVEHARAVDWERPEDAEHYYVPYETFLATARELLTRQRPAVFNGEDWGLRGVELPEVALAW